MAEFTKPQISSPVSSPGGSLQRAEVRLTPELSPRGRTEPAVDTLPQGAGGEPGSASDASTPCAHVLRNTLVPLHQNHVHQALKHSLLRKQKTLTSWISAFLQQRTTMTPTPHLVIKKRSVGCSCPRSPGIGPGPPTSPAPDPARPAGPQHGPNSCWGPPRPAPSQLVGKS